MNRISAVINTRNEESNLGYCLDCLRWCDEIVVVDMGSQDRTIEIARRFTDRVFSVPQYGYVEPARRFAVEQAQGDWVLLLDADESIPRTLAQELRRLSERDDLDAVRIPTRQLILGVWMQHGGWWPQYHVRFFRKAAVNFSDRIHDSNYPKASARSITLPPREELAIHHFAHQDSTQFIEKLNRYTSIEARQLFEAGSPSSPTAALRSFFREFWFRYVSWRGFRDGLHGLQIALLMATYRMVLQMKLWELRDNRRDDIPGRYDDMRARLVAEHAALPPAPPSER